VSIFRQIIPLLLLAGLCIGATCERTVDLEIDQPPTRLVINSSFTLGEHVRVAVSKSQSVLDNSLPEYLANVRVTLYQGDTFLEELQLYVDSIPRIAPYYVTRTFKPEAAITYTVRAEALGFQTVEAHSFIPEPVPFSQLQVSHLTEETGSESYSRKFTYQIDLNFVDPPGEDNFYHLNVFQEIKEISLTSNGDTVVEKRRLERVALEQDNPRIIADAMLGGLLLKNNPNENGYRFQIAIEIVPEFEALGQIFAELRTVSEEYYLYYTTFSRQQNQSDGPFNDPIVIFNNVENGHGYFAGYNIVQDSVSLSF
jgi:hypothetical protein